MICRIAWPRWLWSVIYPSPYESVLTTSMSIMNYCPFRLRHREILLVLAEPHRKLHFHYSCEIPTVYIKSPLDSIRASALTSPLFEIIPKEKSLSAIQNLSWSHVRTRCVKLIGSDLRYKWLSHSEENQIERQSQLLRKLLPPSRSSTHETPLVISSRVRRVLHLVGEGRMKHLKQLVIVDSEAMAVSVSNLLQRQGFHIIQLVGDPTNSNPHLFWDHFQCVAFNHSSTSTIGLLCLRRFTQKTKECEPTCYPSPIIQQVIVAEKPRPGYWNQLYHNILFMLGTKRNASASVKEVFSELETRVSFSERKNKTGRKSISDAIRVLFALGT